MLDPDPMVAAYAIESATFKPSPVGGPTLTAALLKRQAGEPTWLSRTATTGLVGIGNLDTVYSLKDVLLQWRANRMAEPPPQLTVSVYGCIEAIAGSDAVPALVELSQSSDRAARSAATVALGSIGGPDTKAALAARLDDEDPEVRHAASYGLGKGLEPRDVGAKDWAGWLPAANIYEKDPDTVLNNWKNWWQQKGKAKYPSVDSVLAKAQRFRTERPWAKTAAVPGREAPAN